MDLNPRPAEGVFGFSTLRAAVRLMVRPIAFSFFTFAVFSSATASMMSEEDAFDLEPTYEQAMRISRLTPAEVVEISEVLMFNASPRWRKVAMVVGLSMMRFKGRFDDIPDVYYARRIAELVAEGKLEAEGDLRRMRFSEVRIPGR